jgi:tRNASer (uridine44-2'-O)-methyltransferase
MLRIPSTRNTALVGRKRTAAAPEVDLLSVVAKHGGTTGYTENAAKLAKSESRGH